MGDGTGTRRSADTSGELIGCRRNAPTATSAAGGFETAWVEFHADDPEVASKAKRQWHAHAARAASCPWNLESLSSTDVGLAAVDGSGEPKSRASPFCVGVDRPTEIVGLAEGHLRTITGAEIEDILDFLQIAALQVHEPDRIEAFDPSFNQETAHRASSLGGRCSGTASTTEYQPTQSGIARDQALAEVNPKIENRVEAAQLAGPGAREIEECASNLRVPQSPRQQPAVIGKPTGHSRDASIVEAQGYVEFPEELAERMNAPRLILEEEPLVLLERIARQLDEIAAMGGFEKRI